MVWARDAGVGCYDFSVMKMHRYQILYVFGCLHNINTRVENNEHASGYLPCTIIRPIFSIFKLLVLWSDSMEDKIH